MSQELSSRLGRRRFLQLAGTSSLTGLLLAACGGDSTAALPTAQPAADAATVAPAAAPTAAPVVAATVAPAAATAAPVPTSAPAANAVDLRYVFVGGAQKDLPQVQEAFTALVQKKGLNANVAFDLLDWGAYDAKVKLMNTGGEAFDMIFTAPWINNYYQNVNNGTLQPLDDLLPKHAPKLWASMPKATWDAARVGGKIHGVINQQIFPKLFGTAIRSDIVKKYKIDLSKVTSFDQLTPILQQIKAGEPDLKYVYLGDNGSNLEIFGYDPIDQALGFPAVKFTDASAKVVNFLETPEAKAYATRTKAWRDAGFSALDELKGEEIDALYKAGQVVVFLNGVIKPGVENELANKYGGTWTPQPIAPNYLTTGGVVATLNGISTSSKNPEATMQLMELINSDAEVYNLLAKGIEGTHWTWADQAKKVITITDVGKSNYNPNTDWEFGNQFNAYYTDAAAVGNWEKTKAINDSATPSPILGFTFDRTPVETELAQTSEVWTRVWKPIFDGTGEVDANLKTAITDMKAAGSDKIIAELQKQIDAWKAAKA